MKLFLQTKHYGWAALLLVILFALQCGGDGGKIKLEMKFKEGRELVYERSIEQTITIDDAERKASETNYSKGEMTLRVTERLPDGSARIEEQSSWSVSEPQGDSVVEVVSRSETLSYRMLPNGKVTDLEILSNHNSSKWKEYAQSNLEQSQPTFPDEPVPVGYTWMQTVKIFLPSGEMLDASTTYEITETVDVDGRRCAVIEYRGNLILPFEVVESDSLTRQGVDRIDVDGTIFFDYEAGYVFSQQEHTRMTAERSKLSPTAATNYSFFVEGDVIFKLKSEK